MSKIDKRTYQELVRAIEILKEHSIIGPLEAHEHKRRLNLHVGIQQRFKPGKPSHIPLSNEDLSEQLENTPSFISTPSKA